MIRFFILSILAGTTFAAPPNILLIISDDQSWTDYGFIGHQHIETPALDKLATESLTYTRGYVTAPLCRPSLASIFTGLHPHEHGITGNDLLGPNGKKAARTSTEESKLHAKLYEGFMAHPGMASQLKKKNYLTLQTGKWWESDPKESGFTHAMTHGDPARGGRHGDQGLKVSRGGIGEIRHFLNTAKSENKPFFIWHAPFLPHTPHNPPAKLLKKYQKKAKSPHIARYYAMVEWFDQTCHELLNELKTRNLEKNTVVIYVTDNGWIQSPDSGHYAPLSKQDIHEGGIRTPIMIKWLNHIESRMDHTTPVSSIDIAPTILKLAGAEIPQTMQGIDLRDTAALKKRNTVYGADYSHDIAGIHQRTAHLESRYIIEGDWKLIIHNHANFPPPRYAGRPNGKPNNSDGKPELYHLAKDPHERNNLSHTVPEKVKALTEKLNQWWDGKPDKK